MNNGVNALECSSHCAGPPMQGDRLGGGFLQRWQCLGSLGSRSVFLVPQHHISLPLCMLELAQCHPCALFSIPTPPSLSSATSLLSQAPGPASILLTHYLSLLKDNPCQGFLDNPPASSLPDQVPSLSCSPPCAPASLPWALLGWCHINSVPQGCHHLFPC